MDKELMGVVFDIKRFAVHDGPGIRSTVFFKGCPLNCRWCHNPESISFHREVQYVEKKCIGCGACTRICKEDAHTLVNGEHKFDRSKCIACGACESVCMGHALIQCGKEMTVEQVLEQVLKDKNFYQQSGGGVTLSGGECLCQASFCAELLRRLKQEEIHCAVDTSGFVNREAIIKVEPYTDLFLFDIKHMSEEGHRRCTGVSNKMILDNLVYLNESGKRIEIRIPIIPGWNDMAVNEVAGFLRSINFEQKVKLLPYNNLAGSKYTAVGKVNTMPEAEPPDDEQMQLFVELFRRNDIKAEY